MTSHQCRLINTSRMTSRLSIQPTELSDLLVIHRAAISDDRGSLDRIFCSNNLNPLFLTRRIVQVNHTTTNLKGSIRGMHYQTPPFSDAKYVSCLKGMVFDVVVDIRPNSQTFMKWHSEILSSSNAKSIFIPEGFAHGFQCLTDDCQLLYLHTAVYNPEFYAGIHPFDPYISIDWPLDCSNISESDSSRPMINTNTVDFLFSVNPGY